MLIAYCETCGFRIPESDLESGAARKEGENRYFCAKCAAAAGMTPKKPPTKAIPHIPRASPPQGNPTVPAGGRAVTGPVKVAGPANTPPMPAHASAPSRPAVPKPAPQKQDSTLIMVGGGAGVVGLILIFMFIGGKGKESTTVANNDDHQELNKKPTTTVSNTTPPPTTTPTTVTTGNINQPNPPPGGTTPGNSSTESAEERRLKADREMQAMRDERAVKNLEEIKAWYAAHSSDPWTYKDKLTFLAGSNRSSPAGIEAAKLAAELKLPEGEPDADSMAWPRAWDISASMAQEMFENLDGRKFVRMTHPPQPGTPVLLKKTIKMPDDKTIFEFSVRSHDNGDFRLIATIAGKNMVDEIIGGHVWKTFSLDLAKLKGQQVDIILQHHNNDWSFEHAYWQAPRFVDRPSSGAKIVVYDPNAQNVAPVAPVTTPATTVAAGSAWKPIFDGKTIDCLVNDCKGAWKVDNGALMNLPGTNNAGKTNFATEDGDLRVRFEVTNAVGGARIYFNARQGEGGYGVSFDTAALQALVGKSHELIYSMKGDEVSATLDGQPVKVEPNGKPRRGGLQFNARDCTIHVSSIEFREPRKGRVLIDTKSLDSLMASARPIWKAENGYLENVKTGAAQSDAEFDDGELRIRFEVFDTPSFDISVRQCDMPGYSASFDRNHLPSLQGKINELVFLMSGDAVTATLNGQPFKLDPRSKPRKGHLFFYAQAPNSLRIHGAVLYDLPIPEPAATAVASAVNLALDPGFESGAWGNGWSAWGAAGIAKQPENAHSGNYCGVINTGNNGFGQIVKGLTPGVTYEVTAWGKLAKDGEWFHLGVKDYGGPEKSDAFNTTAYKKGSIKFTLGATNTTAAIFAWKVQGPGAAYLDDVLLVPEGAATTAPAAVAGSESKTSAGGTADLKLQYEQLLADVSSLEFKNALSQAQSKLEAAKSDPKLSAVAAMIESDVKIAKLLDDVNKAAAKGAAALADKRAFTIHKTDNKDLNVGKGSSNNVVEFKDDTLTIEQDLGGGKAVSKLTLDQMTALTRYELAKIGIAKETDAELKLASAALVLLQNSTPDVTPKIIRNYLDAAKKSGAPAELISHLQTRIEAREFEVMAEYAFRKLEGLVKDKRWQEARAAIAAFRKDYTATLAATKAAAALEQKSNEVENALYQLKPGLWTSYWSGEPDRFKTMHFARVETKMCWDWKDGSPDPRVPNDNFGVKWAGKLKIDNPGVYKFQASADDHFALFIDGQKIIDANGEKDVTLMKGEHDFKLTYSEDGGGASINFRWKAAGMPDWQEVPADRLWYDPRVIEKYQKD